MLATAAPPSPARSPAGLGARLTGGRRGHSSLRGPGAGGRSVGHHPHQGSRSPDYPLFHVWVSRSLPLAQLHSPSPALGASRRAPPDPAAWRCALSPPSAGCSSSPSLPGQRGRLGRGHRRPGAAPSEGNYHLQLPGPQTREEWRKLSRVSEALAAMWKTRK